MACASRGLVLALGNQHALRVEDTGHKPDAIHTLNDCHLFDVIAVGELETCIRPECTVYGRFFVFSLANVSVGH